MMSRVISCSGAASTLLVALVLAIAACAPRLASAQAVSGTILGTVTDSSGSVIPNAKVTIVNEGTGLTRTCRLTSNGEFTAPSLPTGRYTVIAELTGFKTLTLSNIELGVDQRARIDLKLEVGGDDRVGQRRGHESAGPDHLVRAGDDGARPNRLRRCRSTAATSST